MIRNRKIGPVLATGLVANNMIGSGIFLLPATLATVGSITILGWIIATAGALLCALVLARLGQIAPQAGGPSAYAQMALGPYMGFQSYFIYWICAWVGNLAIAVAAIGYLSTFFPGLADSLHSAIAAIALIWFLTLVNILGPRISCQLDTFTLAAGLIPIVLVATAGWLYFDPDVFAASWNVSGQPAMQAIPGSLVLVFWAFVGLESASVAAGVVENPNRNVAIATIGGVALAGIVYIASCSVIMGVIPAATLAKSSAPFADAVKLMIGPAAGAFVAVMACLKATGTLCGWIMLTAQTGKAAADRGMFPAILARTDRHGVPVANLLIMAVIMSITVFATRSPTVGEQFSKLIEVSVIFCLIVYVYACVAAWQNGKTGIRIIAFGAMAFCIGVVLLSGMQMLALTAAAILASLLLYPFVMSRLERVPDTGV